MNQAGSKLSKELLSSEKTETAYFAMGCFWSVEGFFGAMEGVQRTRVGYAGGTTENPTYRTISDHIESVELIYDPSRISYQDLLALFFQHHKPEQKPWKRQYMAAAFFHDAEQERHILQAKEELTVKSSSPLFTAAIPLERFYPAEERHQKYKLQRQPLLMEELGKRYSSFHDLNMSTAAARINGYLYGYGKGEETEKRIKELGLSATTREILLQKTKTNPFRCSS